MNIECILRREGGTKADIDGIQYHFAPLDDGAHVADVERTDHIDRFLAIPEGYRVYHGALQATTKPVELSLPVIADPTDVRLAPSLEARGLLGSSVHESSYDINGTTYSLGDIVRRAHEAAGLTADEWNALDEDDRHAKIDIVLDDLADAEPQEDRDALVQAYKAKFGKAPHHNAKTETIKAALAAEG